MSDWGLDYSSVCVNVPSLYYIPWNWRTQRPTQMPKTTG